MRHKVAGYKLKRNISSRKALFKGLVTSMIEHERIVTTVHGRDTLGRFTLLAA